MTFNQGGGNQFLRRLQELSETHSHGLFDHSDVLTFYKKLVLQNSQNNFVRDETGLVYLPTLLE